MFASEAQILQLLAVLGLFHGVAAVQIISHYFLGQRPMSWSEARKFCQMHYVDLAVLNTEEHYFAVLNATLESSFSFWLGLQRRSIFSSWTWVNGEELNYKHWYRWNYEGHCASLESMLKTDEKLLARYCDEVHMVVCQGPVSPESVMVESVGPYWISLTWKVSHFMQMTPHSYNVTTCTSTCDTLVHPYTNGSAFMSVNISNLKPATEHLVEIVAFLVRPDSDTGVKTVLQSDATALQVKTANSFVPRLVFTVVLKMLKFVSLAPPLWILYRILKKDNNDDADHAGDDCESNRDTSAELSSDDTVINLIPEKTREIGKKG